MTNERLARYANSADDRMFDRPYALGENPKGSSLGLAV
jgi:hypothetical protein